MYKTRLGLSSLSHVGSTGIWLVLLAVVASRGSAGTLTFTAEYGVAYYDSGVTYNWGPWTTSGGTPPYTYSLTAGPLPTGFQLNASTGAITGSSTVPGIYQITVKVTDSVAATASITTDLQVLAPVSVATTSLPNGILNNAYSATLQGAGGWPSGSGSTYSYTWSASGLPAGLTLNTSTGVISGTPTSLGTSSVTITAADGDMSTNKLLGLSVVGTTIQTSPEGLQFTVDGGALQTAPQTLGLSAGSHTIAVAATQSGPGTQYVFSSWSDGGAASHSIAVGSTAATYTASFNTQYQLTIAASPAAGGTVSPSTGSYYNTGTVVPVSSTPNSGFTFAGWSGNVANAGAASTSVTMTAPQTVTANFTAVTNVTIQTSPPGLHFTVDSGITQTTPQTLVLSQGTHTIAVASLQAGPAGIQYGFSSWSDGGAASHSIAVGATPATYTASFNTQYQLLTSIIPAAGGSVTPSSGTYYIAGTVVSIAASPNSGYTFSGWNGSVANSLAASTSVTMSAPESVTANFAPPTGVTIQTNPPGLQFTVDGGAAQTSPQTLSLTQGSHTIAVSTTEAGSPGTQYLFTGWSDGGAASHSITVGSSPATYTASFNTQFQLTILASPIAGGTVAPSSGSYYPPGTAVSIAATPNVGYTFGGWSGTVASANAASTTVTVSAPETVTANFASLTGVTVQTNPTGLQFSVDGGAAQIAPQTLNLSQGQHTIAVATTQAGSAGTQYIFTSWSDGGAASHSITVGSSTASYTASFQTQYQLTISASPAAGGSVTPASGSDYNSGTMVSISATANSGYTFTGWSGTVAGANAASTTVTMNAPETVTANFASLTGVTIQTSPPGLQISVDGGAAQTAPQSLSLSQGPHIIAVPTTQPGGTGTQYVFTGWSDGGAASHTITVGATAASYTASFKTQYQLTIAASPAGGGTVTPASGGFYDLGTAVPISATAASGYSFTGWSGSVANVGSASSTVTMNAPQTVTANFASQTGVTIQTSPPGLQFSVDGGAAQTSPQTLSLSQGSHTLGVSTTQPGGTGTQYVFTGWSDGGAASHTITVGATAASYTASFKTQYQLTIAASPAGGGTVTPASGGFYDSGTAVPISATAASGYLFTGWSGSVASANAASTTTTMNAPQTVTANFASQTGVTIQTNPSGLQFSVDGTAPQTAPQTLNLTLGSHTIAVAPTQPGSSGTQYVFTGWSDGLTASHTISVGTASATYTASFKTQYQLVISVSPVAGGSATPISGIFFDQDTVEPVNAIPNGGYAFAGWSGSVASPNAASTTTTMTGPQSLTANFVSQMTLVCTPKTGPATLGVNYSANCTATGGAAPYTWSISAGALPAGLALAQSSATATITGTPTAAGQYSYTVKVADGSSPQQTATQVYSGTINGTPTPTSLTVAPPALNFNARTDGANPPIPQSISVFSNQATAFTAAASETSGGSWLAVSPASGQTPGSLAVTVNAASLSPGTYSGQITISAPTATPTSIVIPVSITMVAVSPPQLSVVPTQVTVVTVQGGAAVQQQIAISNTGGGTLNVTATASGGNWLTLANTSGSASPGSPFVVNCTLDPQSLSPGTYQGQILIGTTDGQQTQTIPVKMAVNNQPQSIVLTQTGLQFQALSQGVVPPSQSFAILNGGVGAMNWTATPQTFGSSSGWITVAPGSGTAQAGSATSSGVSVSVNPQNLPPGTYYGQIDVAASNAGNTPEVVSIVLNVLPPAAPAPPVLSSLGLLPVGTLGGTPTDATTITNVSGQPLSFTSTATTDDGGNWLVVTPTSGTIPAGASTQVSVQVNTTGLTAGIRHGTVRLGFSDQTVQTVSVISVLGASSAGTQAKTAHTSSCVPNAIGLVDISLGDGFAVTAASPVPLTAKIVDSCGHPVVGGAGVLAAFGNQDPSIHMVSDGSAWGGTWTPNGASSSVAVTISAFLVVGQNLLGAQAVVTGAVQTASDSAGAAANFVANSASYLQSGQVSAGSWVAIFGDRLADSQQVVGTAPFPPSLVGTRVLLGETPLPLLFVSANQVNALIPYSLNSSTDHPLLVQRDGTGSVPVDVTQADVLPAIYSTNQAGTGQGAILIAGTASLAAPAGAFPGSLPVQSGQYLSIFASGLGPVTNTPADGAAAPSVEPLATMTLTPTITIGSVPAPVIQYKGLAPGLVGLYQLNVQVPPGVPAGGAVPVTITIGGSTSNTVTIAVQ